MKLLIVKTSSMGDVVHALPAVSDIAAARPDARMHWLVEERFAAIPAAHPGIARVWPLQWRQWRKQLGARGTWQAMRALRHGLQAERFDAVLDVQGLIKSAIWARQAGAPVWGYGWGSAREPLATLAYSRWAQVGKHQQAIARNRQLAAALLGYALPTTPPRFELGAALPAHQRPATAVLIPMASRAEKLWPEAAWIDIAQRLRAAGLTVSVAWGSEAERERAERIAVAGGAQVAPRWDVGQAVAALGQVRWVVGLDTGLTHIAAACGANTVGIYCDHSPGLAGITGDAYTASLGGVGQRPEVDAVWQAVQTGGLMRAAHP